MIRAYRLLVADDDDAFRETVCGIFAPYFELQVARTGSEAAALAEHLSLDVALCDLQMPQLSGLDVLRMWKQRDSRRPGILMTAACNADLQRQAGVSFDAILRKPFTRRELLDSLADVVAEAYCDPAFASRLRSV